MSSVIKLAAGAKVRGARFWRQDFAPTIRPRFEVYEFVGHDAKQGKYWFRGAGRNNRNCLISKGYHQLGVNGFHPFVVPEEASDALA